MDLTIGEKIRILVKRKGITMGDLADATNQTRQNFSNKMIRDNFTEKDAREIAAALNCELKIEFVLEDGTVI